MNIDVEKIKAEIKAQIKICDTYLKRDSDPDAQQRVAELEKNPCSSGLFYLNAIYKDGYKEEVPYNINKSITLDYNTEIINGYIIREQRIMVKK